MKDMAVRFYKKGDAEHLAEQLLAILESPELQHSMAEHNFRAGIEMTMTSVVNNYLRWFELHKCKKGHAQRITAFRSGCMSHPFLWVPRCPQPRLGGQAVVVAAQRTGWVGWKDFRLGRRIERAF